MSNVYNPRRQSIKHKKPSSFKKNLIFIGAGIFVGLMIFIIFKLFNFYNTIYEPKTNTSPQQVKKIEEKKVFNFLVLGYGGGNHDGPYLTDTIMVMHLDMTKKQVFMISVPRDLWVKIPTKSGTDFHEKINGVYQMELFPKTYPDVDTNYQQTKDITVLKRIIKDVTGLTVDNYLGVDFDGFTKAIDILGGVDINVDTTFDDYEYPVDGKEDDLCGKKPEDLPELEKIATQSPTLAFPCRYEHLHFDAGKTHMDGATALKYARSRHSLQDGTDFGRAKRQQKVIEAVRGKVLSLSFIPKIIPLMDELQNHIATDVGPDELKKLLAEGTKAGEYTIDHLVLSNDNYLKDGTASTGAYILQPDEGIDQYDEIKQWIANSIAGITPTPTPDQEEATPSARPQPKK